MATLTSKACADNAPVVTPNQAGTVVSQRGSLLIAVALVIAGTFIKLVTLPAGCVPASLVLDFDEIDGNASPTTTAEFGILNAAGDGFDVSAGTLTAVQLGAGGLQGALTAAFSRVTATTSDRVIAVKLGGTVATAKAGTVGATLGYRAKD